jgi:short-subunit dehydrogenase
MNKLTIVITGSSRGLGFELAKKFLFAGHNVVINSTSEQGLEKALQKLSLISKNITGIAGSVCKMQTHKQLIDKAIENFGQINIWINNAGVPQLHTDFVNIDVDNIKNVLDVNVLGLMLGTKIAADFMVKQKYGEIYNVLGFGSDGRIMKKMILYGTSKCAVNYFTKAFAKELENTPVKIGLLQPGMIRTDFLNFDEKSRTPEEKKRLQKVYKYLADDANVVSNFFVEKILKNNKKYTEIIFLTKSKIILRMLKMTFFA